MKVKINKGIRNYEVKIKWLLKKLDYNNKQAVLVALLESQKDCMEQILELYGNMDAFDLEDIINQKGLKNFAQPETLIDTYDMLRIFGNNNKNS